MDFKDCIVGKSQIFEKSRSMSRIALRDDRLILWGMEATPLDLYLNKPVCYKTAIFKRKLAGISTKIVFLAKLILLLLFHG